MSPSIRPCLFRLLLSICLGSVVLPGFALAQNHRVYEQGTLPNDSRLSEPKDLNGYFPFEVPEGKEAWKARAEELRTQVLIANGLWPMPPKTPLNAVIHGKVQRDGFTVEKVYFESLPGHFVSGLLFRPDDGKTGIKRPAVLSPHGHGGRQMEYSDEAVRKQIEDGAEKFEKSGKFPKLARCAHLARMGCVTFIFDMLGYTDSHQISYELAHRFAKQRPELESPDRWGLFSTQAEQRLQSVMGIQTWNAIRCLDFLEQLPDVDPERMAVTGGSGGGTQTILLCAIDPRPIAAFPNGMVSTSMQGGCTCENCTLLRIGTGNVELAALFAPKPQGMTAANDWTKEMMEKGYPELQQVYEMLGAKENVFCRPLLHFPHNYNYVSRATMYEWFNKHMKLGVPPDFVEADYEPLTKEEYTVWNEGHPAPAGGVEYETSLTKDLAEVSDHQIADLIPESKVDLPEFRRVIGEAFETIVGRDLPAYDEIQRIKVAKEEITGFILFKDKLRLQPRGEEFPVVSLFPKHTKWNGEVVIWIDGAGKRGLFDESGAVRTQARRLLDDGISVVSADLFQQGDFLPGDEPLKQQRVVKNPREAPSYTFAYNDTLFVRRVHDILTLVSWIQGDDHQPKQIQLIGVNGAGPLVALAGAIAGDRVDALAIDTKGFRFRELTDYRDPNFLPGSIKYGDVPALLALNAPRPLFLGGEKGRLPEMTKAVYSAADAQEALKSYEQLNFADAAAEWLVNRN